MHLIAEIIGSGNNRTWLRFHQKGEVFDALPMRGRNAQVEQIVRNRSRLGIEVSRLVLNLVSHAGERPET